MMVKRILKISVAGAMLLMLAGCDTMGGPGFLSVGTGMGFGANGYAPPGAYGPGPYAYGNMGDGDGDRGGDGGWGNQGGYGGMGYGMYPGDDGD